MGGDGADTVAFDSALLSRLTMASLLREPELTPLASLLSPVAPIFGGASFGDTAAGNDTLEFTGIASATKIDMGSGTNFVTGTGVLNGSSVYGGSGKDTFSFAENSLNSARIGSQGGNDSLAFTSASTSGAIFS